MKKELVIGILGGMGPEATVNCFEKLVKNTPADCDQEHLRIVIINDPKIPDRSGAILNNGPSPVPVLLQNITSLKSSGADFVIIPCVTVHYFLEELLSQCDMPVLSILDAMSNHICRNHSQMKTIGLLGTSGTIQSGIFQKKLTAAGIETVVCSDPVQQQVMEAIYNIKNKNTRLSHTDITDSLASAAKHLIQQGAQGIIAGCTEIPLALSAGDITVPFFDSLLILARSAIRRAGREPV